VAVADGEYVLLHGRFTGNGKPRAWIAGDIVRVATAFLLSTGMCCNTKLFTVRGDELAS
jgi:hypothetical protein